MKTPKLIRVKLCPDVTCPDDSIGGMWHTAWRKPNNENLCVFFHRGKWWHNTAETPVVGPFNAREEALGDSEK